MDVTNFSYRYDLYSDLAAASNEQIYPTNTHFVISCIEKNDFVETSFNSLEKNSFITEELEKKSALFDLLCAIYGPYAARGIVGNSPLYTHGSITSQTSLWEYDLRFEVPRELAYYVSWCVPTYSRQLQRHTHIKNQFQEQTNQPYERMYGQDFFDKVGFCICMAAAKSQTNNFPGSQNGSQLRLHSIEPPHRLSADMHMFSHANNIKDKKIQILTKPVIQNSTDTYMDTPSDSVVMPYPDIEKNQNRLSKVQALKPYLEFIAVQHNAEKHLKLYLNLVSVYPVGYDLQHVEPGYAKFDLLPPIPFQAIFDHGLSLMEFMRYWQIIFSFGIGDSLFAFGSWEKLLIDNENLMPPAHTFDYFSHESSRALNSITAKNIQEVRQYIENPQQGSKSSQGLIKILNLLSVALPSCNVTDSSEGAAEAAAVTCWRNPLVWLDNNE